MNEKLPHAFIEAMKSQLGSDYDEFVSSLDASAPASIRFNPSKGKDKNNGRRVPWSQHGIYLSERPVYTLDPLFHAGAYYVQEASSMFLDFALRKAVDLSASYRVLDLCAAPGGKSTQLAALLSDSSLLVSNEVIRSRATILSENIQKWGYPNVLVTNNDPEDFSTLGGFFDIVVVDAPCSGEGLFRKDNRAIAEWSEQNVALCAARQRRILNDIWPTVKEGGIVIYCTCTFNPTENEQNLNEFAVENSLSFVDVDPDPSWGVSVIRHGDVIGYRFFPHKIAGEGFFLSVMKKKETQPEMRRKIKKKINLAKRETVSEISAWLTEPEILSFKQHDDLVFAIPRDLEEDIEFLIQHLRFVYTGVTVGTVKHTKLIPHHSLAMSTKLKHAAFQRVSLNLENALHYLRKDVLDLEVKHTGFNLVLFDDVPLGWMNVLTNRINNLYPPEWRIRMAIS